MAVEQESDSDSKAAKSHLPTTLGVGMLPTPSKTPRKRAAPAEVIQSTARVLFPGRTAKVEDAMPSTRKSRKGKRVGLFSLDGLDEDGDDEAGKIPIYTDSKERVPNLDEGEANPFVTRSRGKNKAEEVEAKVEPQRRSRKRVEVIEEETEMEKKVKNDEGMIYVL